jgi:hypothetical protein
MVTACARQKAAELIAQVSHGMLLVPNEQTREELSRLTDEILQEPLGQLWEKA